MSRLDHDKIARARSALETVLIGDGFLMVPDFVTTAENLNGLPNELAIFNEYNFLNLYTMVCD